MRFNDLSRDDRLLTVRRGNALFARKLGELSDAELDAPCLLDGWSRKHLVAHVGYNAVALCRLLEWARTGVETPMYESPEARGQEIDEGATLGAGALRNLFTHTSARLDEAWRTLPESSWEAEVRTAQGRAVPASETIWMRVREVWIHSVDLGNGVGFDEFPVGLCAQLLDDIVGMWRRKELGEGLVLRPDGDDKPIVVSDSDSGPVISGTVSALARWASGRGGEYVTTDDGEVPQPPRWL